MTRQSKVDRPTLREVLKKREDGHSYHWLIERYQPAVDSSTLRMYDERYRLHGLERLILFEDLQREGGSRLCKRSWIVKIY